MKSPFKLLLDKLNILSSINKPSSCLCEKEYWHTLECFHEICQIKSPDCIFFLPKAFCIAASDFVSLMDFQ